MRIAILGLSILLVMGCEVAAAQPANSPAAGGATQPESTKSVLADEGPQFEVATIKPSDPAACCARTYSRQGRRFGTNPHFSQGQSWQVV